MGVDVRKAFIDPVTRRLKCHGFMVANEPDDIIIDVPDDFDLAPGEWRREGTEWVADDAHLWAAYQQQVREALQKTSVTMERIAEAVATGATIISAPDVVAFSDYRKALRAILSQPQPEIIPTDLPVHPGYPAGT